MSFIFYKSDNVSFLPDLKDDFKVVCAEANIRMGYTSNAKFKDDKFLIRKGNYLIFIDGVILNKKKILSDYGISNLSDYIFSHLDKGDINFMLAFRGSFLGIVHDFTTNNTHMFNDHIGSKPIHYTEAKPDSFIVSSSLDVLFESKKELKIENILSKDAAYMLLSYGNMLDNHTLEKSAFKLSPGSVLTLKGFKLSIRNYYRLSFDYKSNVLSEKLVNDLDTNFSTAVKLAFEKDRECNYTHFCGLSGGLDSRMTVLAAHELGYTNQVNMTFSQSDYLDETIAKSIARDLHHKWIFKFLDYGHILEPIEKNTNVNAGSSSYFGVSHTKDMYEAINFDSYGILHSGQLGDAVIGAAALGVKEIHKQKLSKINFVSKISCIQQISEKYENAEEFFYYNRGINGANSGLSTVFPHTESYSPFYDIDFLEFCFSISPNVRKDHKLYFEWLRIKYPEATEYIWEATGSKPLTKRVYNIKGIDLTLKNFIYLFRYKFRLLDKSKHMNPVDYWYSQNDKLRNILDDYFSENLQLVLDIELRNDVSHKYTNGMVSDKLEVLTLLAAIKKYFS